MDFWTKLAESARARNSLLCVGLDPQPELIPSRYGSVSEFNRAIIDATAEVACVYKPNIAFYEAMGDEGLQALRETLDYIPADTPVIMDAKRNDITSTAAAYARAIYDVWGADALTVNPYLGRDGVEPFLQHRDRGVFVLCKTSNPSAGEIQDWTSGGEPLYREVARLATRWAGKGQIGLVVGATYPDVAADLRIQCPEAWFLVPGVGTQGGDLEAVLRAALRPDGLGLLINVSRAILYADDPRTVALGLSEQINAVRADLDREGPPSAREREVRALARMLFEAECVRFGDFVLHSGAHSPVYVDLRRLVSHPRILGDVAHAYGRLMEPLSYDRIAAIPYAGLPIGTAVSLQTGVPLIYPRREAKAYGTRRQIEGEYETGDRVVLLDDLISSGGSKLEAVQPLLAEGLQVEDVVVLIDREQGGAEDLGKQGYRLHSVLTLRELADALVREGLISADDGRRVHEYLANPAEDANG
jgi:uridine monophosphate synthetase